MQVCPVLPLVIIFFLEEEFLVELRFRLFGGSVRGREDRPHGGFSVRAERQLQQMRRLRPRLQSCNLPLRHSVFELLAKQFKQKQRPFLGSHISFLQHIFGVPV